MTQGVMQIQQSLVKAGDMQVARVVAMVDALPDRGEADALIAPLRPRLAHLRPARPLSFTRLLFTPLNPVIMPTPAWQRCSVGLPRSALSLLALAVRAALPAFADWQGDWDSLGAAGLALWPAAAAVLDGLAMPLDWHSRTSLSTAEFAPVVSAAAAVLHEAPLIDWLERQRQAVQDEEVCAILVRSKARGPAALDTVVSVLLGRLPVPARVAALAAEAGGEQATGRAVDRLAASLSGPAGDSADLRDAALEACRVATILHALEHRGSPERRAQLEQIRRTADASNRRSFSQAARHTLALVHSAATATFDDGAVAAMESSARDLRRLETAARRLGSGDYYDAQLAQAAAAVRDVAGDLGLADRVRLVEILAGPEQALAMLTGERSVAPATA